MGWLLLAFTGGTVLAIQAGVNGRLGKELGHPLIATLASFLIGTLGLFLYALLTRAPFPTLATIGRTPLWIWCGGLLGAFYLSTIILIVPKIGVATAIGWVVAGQMTMSLLLDHFGLLGLERHPVTPPRLLGMCLIAAGVLLLKRS